jgi:hypothetical protein
VSNVAHFVSANSITHDGISTGGAVGGAYGTLTSGSVLPLGTATHFSINTDTGIYDGIALIVDDATLLQTAFNTLTLVSGATTVILNASDASFSSGAGVASWSWVHDGHVLQAGNTVTATVNAMSILLTIPVVTSTEAILEWTNTSSVIPDAYTVNRNGVDIAVVTSALSYVDMSLQPSTSYSYFVSAADVSDTTTDSNTVTITTADLTDEFNCACETVSTFSTLAQLRARTAIQIGYAAQAANLPAGISAEINEYLYSAQKQLYDKYKSLRTERMFKWTMIPGERYYSLTAAEGSCVKQVDPKKITWVGFEDLNQAWYQLIAGINPLWYTRAQISTGWPTRYEIRSCIEIFPAPQAAYTLWIKAHFQLEPFAADGDRTTLDDELVLLFAVANLKSAKGKPDAARAMNQATARLKDLTAANHVLRRYVPGTTTDSPATPPRFLPLNGAPP